MVALLRSVGLLDNTIYRVRNFRSAFTHVLTDQQEWDRISKTTRSTNVQVRYKRSTIYDAADDSDAISRPAKRAKAGPSGSKDGKEGSTDGKREEVGEVGADEEDMTLDLGDLDM